MKKNKMMSETTRKNKKMSKKKKMIGKYAAIALGIGIIAVGGYKIAGYVQAQMYYDKTFGDEMKAYIKDLSADSIIGMSVNCSLTDGMWMVSDKEVIQELIDELKDIRVAKHEEEQNQQESKADGESASPISGNGMTINTMNSSEIVFYTEQGEIMIESGAKFGKTENGLVIGNDEEETYFDPIEPIDEMLKELQNKYDKDKKEKSLDTVLELAKDDKITWKDFEGVEGALSAGEFLMNTEENWWLRAFNDSEDGSGEQIYNPDEEPDHVVIYSKKGSNIDIREEGLEAFVKTLQSFAFVEEKETNEQKISEQATLTHVGNAVSEK